MPRKMQTHSGDCAACDKSIAGAYIAFICEVHCICHACIKTMPGLVTDWTGQEGMCPYCKMEGAGYIEETEFKHPFEQNAPKYMTIEKSIRIADESRCCWATQYDNMIAVGMYNSPVVNIVNVTGSTVSHTLPIGRRVTSGLYLDTKKCLICVKDPDFIMTCNIHPRHTAETNPSRETRVDVQNSINVFPMMKYRYGIFCENPGRKDYRIEIFSKRSIYTQNKPEPKQILTIDLPNPCTLDRACGTPEDLICVSSYVTQEVCIFDNTGVRINIIGDHNSATIIPGIICSLRSLEATGDGALVVIDQRGDVQTYIEGNGWEMVKTDDSLGTNAGVLSNTRVWLVRYTKEGRYSSPTTFSIDVYDTTQYLGLDGDDSVPIDHMSTNTAPCEMTSRNRTVSSKSRTSTLRKLSNFFAKLRHRKKP